MTIRLESGDNTHFGGKVTKLSGNFESIDQSVFWTLGPEREMSAASHDAIWVTNEPTTSSGPAILLLLVRAHQSTDVNQPASA